MANDPVIVGMGMVSAVGLSPAETMAAVRAKTMRFTDTTLRDRAQQPFVLSEIPEKALLPADQMTGVPPGTTARTLRLARIATAALRQCLTLLGPNAGSVGLSIARPEFQTARPIKEASLLDLLGAQLDGRLDMAKSSAAETGRAGGLVALGKAADLVRSGRADFMLAGGVDTYRDLVVLGTLDKEQRVKSALNRDGFVPGEAAAFLMLATRSTSAMAGLTPLARLSDVASGIESGHLYSDQPYRGDGLASTVARLISSSSDDDPFAAVWSSMNGESHWGKEWGVTYLRNRRAFLDDHDMRHPADCFGDIGAAAGPMMVGLAAMGIRAGNERAPALVYCSSDRGARAALAMRGA